MKRQENTSGLKKASLFEIVAARLWNVLNEGKPFTPVFVLSILLLYEIRQWQSVDFWLIFLTAVCLALPAFAMMAVYDFPLHLRWWIWPLWLSLFLWVPFPPWPLYGWVFGLYFFFTVFFWGTLYYHLRIGTPWTNFTRFWRLVLKNSDSTSGNAQEQIPKILLLTTLIYGMMQMLAGSQQAAAGITKAGSWSLDWESAQASFPWAAYLAWTGAAAVVSVLVHRLLFRWRPEEYEGWTQPLPQGGAGESRMLPAKGKRRVFVVVIDGCRKDRMTEADTPFIDWLQENGTTYRQMETVYPARTVVCFSSMFTGAYPGQHGIQSNMVWRPGVRCESIFDSLRKVGKTGRLLGVAHLIDAFGRDVESYTAVMHNDRVDQQIMEQARELVANQDPDLVIVQLISTDQTGHSRGALYEEYRGKIEEADRHIAGFYRWLEEQGKMEGGTFVVCADHGQSDGIGGHGHLDEGERFVPFVMQGAGIKQGCVVEEKHSLVSVAPTLAHLLSAPLPGSSRGPILADALEMG